MAAEACTNVCTARDIFFHDYRIERGVKIEFPVQFVRQTSCQGQQGATVQCNYNMKMDMLHNSVAIDLPATLEMLRLVKESKDMQ